MSSASITSASSSPAARGFAARWLSDAMLWKSALSLLDQAVVSGTNFAVTVVLGTQCGKPELGLYYLILQVLFFVRGMQEQLIAAPYYVYSGRKSGRELAEYTGSSLVHQVMLLAAAAIALFAVATLGEFDSGTRTLVSMLVGVTPLFLLREFARQSSFAHLRVTEALALDVVVSIIQVITLLLLAWFHALDAVTAYAVLALGWGAATIGWFSLRRGTFQAADHAAWADWKRNWRFSRWALLSQLVGCSMPYLLPWIVAAVYGYAAAGDLGVGTTLIGFANMFVLGMSNFICPRAARAFANDGSRELQAVLKKAAVFYTVVLGPFAMAMFVSGDALMQWVYGPEFASAGRIMAVLSFGALVNSWGILAGNGLWAMNLPASGFRADAAAFVACLLATLLLIGPLGPLGAAVASTIGIVVGTGVRVHALRRELRTKTA